jgi:hypothetical protein
MVQSQKVIGNMAKPSINKAKPPFDIVIDLFVIACKNIIADWNDRSMRTKGIDVHLKTDNGDAVCDQLGEMFVAIGHPRVAYFDTHFALEMKPRRNWRKMRWFLKF